MAVSVRSGRPFATPMQRVVLLGVGLSMMLGSWLLATPLGAGVDESSHVVAAVADSHLKFKHSSDASGHPLVLQKVLLPRTFGMLNTETLCYFSTGGPGNCHAQLAECIYIVDNAGHCSPPLQGDASVGTAFTYTGRYPPAYLVFTGLPTLVSSTPGVIWFMRLLSVLLSGSLVIAAFVCALRWGRRPLLLLGLGVCLTPTFLGTSVIVNPSSLEMAAALAVWTAGVILARDATVPDRRLIDIFGASSVLLTIARPSSPSWTLVIMVILGLLAGRSRLRDLWALRRVRIWAVVIAAGGIGTVIWVIAVHGTTIIKLAPQPLSQALPWALHSLPSFIHQAIGNLGSGRVTFPLTITVTIGVMGLAVLFLGALNLRRAGGSRWLGLSLLVLALIGVPVLLAVTNVPEMTPYGRYLYPLGIGLPILLGGLSAPRWRRVSALGVLIMAVAQAAALLHVLHRWSEGTGAAWRLSPTGPESWNPPAGVIVVGLIGIAGPILVGLVLLWSLREDPTPQSLAIEYPIEHHHDSVEAAETD
ncbi:MAG: DUF2142 domain-containing protein [Actinomycetes bacterium]